MFESVGAGLRNGNEGIGPSLLPVACKSREPNLGWFRPQFAGKMPYARM
jgi:hypothetical protein